MITSVVYGKGPQYQKVQLPHVPHHHRIRFGQAQETPDEKGVRQQKPQQVGQSLPPGLESIFVLDTIPH